MSGPRKKGAVDLVVIIAVVLMVTVLAGSFSMWGGRATEDLQKTAKKDLDKGVEGITEQIHIESASGRAVTIRNRGGGSIGNETLSVYVDGALARCSWDAGTIGQNEVATCREICVP